jgi:ribosomal protein S18 acetylase RimI-like enzyme
MNPPDAMMLRLARVSDASVMAEMSRDLIESGLVWRYTARRMATMIDNTDSIALVACDESGIQGFAVMQCGDERAHLSLLCVKPEQQRRGIGRRLNQWLVDSAQVAGITTIHLELRADNAAALVFYERLGFAETQTVADYYGERLAARRMVRDLRSDADSS